MSQPSKPGEEKKKLTEKEASLNRRTNERHRLIENKNKGEKGEQLPLQNTENRASKPEELRSWRSKEWLRARRPRERLRSG